MHQIPLSASLLSFLDELEFTAAALEADPESAELAAPFEAAIEGWEPIFRAERAGRRAVTRAEAVVGVRNEGIDRSTTRFGGAVLLEAGQDRKSPLFKRFFPTAPSIFIRQALRKQCELTRDVMLPELAKLPEASPLRAYAEPLRSSFEAAIAALDARAKARGERTSSANDVAEWKEGVNALRTTTYAELIKLGVARGYGRAWADAFFRPEGRVRAAEDGTPEETPAPAGAPADAVA